MRTGPGDEPAGRAHRALAWHSAPGSEEREQDAIWLLSSRGSSAQPQRRQLAQHFPSPAREQEDTVPAARGQEPDARGTAREEPASGRRAVLASADQGRSRYCERQGAQTWGARLGLNLQPHVPCKTTAHVSTGKMEAQASLAVGRVARRRARRTWRAGAV